MQILIKGAPALSLEILRQTLRTAIDRMGLPEDTTIITDESEIDEGAEVFCVAVREADEFPKLQDMQDALYAGFLNQVDEMRIRDWFGGHYQALSFSTPPQRAVLNIPKNNKRYNYRDMRRNIRMTGAHFGRR